MRFKGECFVTTDWILYTDTKEHVQPPKAALLRRLSLPLKPPSQELDHRLVAKIYCTVQRCLAILIPHLLVAPCSHRYCTTRRWPLSAAQCSGVLPR